MKNTMLLVLGGILALTLTVPAASKSEVREVGSEFSGIELATHGDMTIKFGDKVELVVEAEDEILSKIITVVKGDTLVIYKKDKHSNWLSDLFSIRRETRIRYHLTVLKGQLSRLDASSHGGIFAPELSGDKVSVALSSHGDVTVESINAKSVDLELSSHGDLKIDQLNADHLSCDMSSHGMVEILNGAVKRQVVTLSSHGDYLADGLKSEDIEIELSSHGQARVYATERLEASVTSHGDVYYRGDPKLDVDRSERKQVQQIR